MPEFTYFFFSILAYILFLIIALAFKLPSKDNPNNAICLAHILFGLGVLILATCHGVASNWSLGSPWSLVIGFAMYIFYHYAIALNFFLLATRSVSANLIATLAPMRFPTRKEELYQAYADGKGFDFVRQDRLKWMLQRGMIRQKEGTLILTEGGSRSADISQLILKIWGLIQIGSRPKDAVM